MKIIGSDDSQGYDKKYIIEITRNDLVKLLGYYNAYDEALPKLRVNDEITISDMYQQLYSFKDNQKKYEQISKGLNEMAKNLILLNLMKEISDAN